MEVILDTVCLKSLRRLPNGEIPQRGFPPGIQKLTMAISQRKFMLVIDSGGGIRGEWGETCDHEFVDSLIAKLESIGGIRTQRPTNSIPSPHRRRLQGLGFIGTIDKLIVRTSLALSERHVISDDSDFWNPHDEDSPGDKNAPVALYLRDNLEINVQLLGFLFPRNKKR